MPTAFLSLTYPSPRRLPRPHKTMLLRNVRAPQRSPWVCCQTPLPPSFDAMHLQATNAAIAAITAGVPLIELSFPAVPRLATAALNQLLDANRAYAKEFLFACRPRLTTNNLYAMFQEPSEARLAAKAYGPDMPFDICSLPKNDAQIPSFVSSKDDGLIVVVQPGFNVDEWIAMERLEGALPIVAINPDLDKVRGSYYPRLFYPKLHKVKDRFLSRFVEVYYLKPLSNGGTLYRCFPDQWKLFYSRRDGAIVEIGSYSQRPSFHTVEQLLSKYRQEDLLS